MSAPLSSRQLHLERPAPVLETPSRRAETAPMPRNATLLGVAPIKDLEQAIARSRRLAEGSAPVIHVERTEPAPRQPAAAAPRQPAATEEVHWESFEDLGLGERPSRLANRAVKLAASSYRLLRLSIVVVIATALAGYIAATAFYWFSTSWSAPIRVSPTDERVVALRSELAVQQGERDRIAAELDRANRTTQRGRDASKADPKAREALQAGLARQDQLIAGLQRSPYLRALTGGATIAFVPYGNDGATAGTPVFACRLGMVLCREVGRVIGPLPGEATVKHPRRDRMVRGRMVELALDAGERAAAAQDVLFLGGKPLGL